MVRKYKSTRGITLVALVITIIVLLILAGVTIATLNGDNGLITRVKQAKQNTEEAKKREQSSLEGISSQIDSELGTQYDETKKVNKPQISTGMTPVKYTKIETDLNSTEIEETTSSDTDWYNYGSDAVANRKWANVQTKDGSMWVWIPRYAYKIDSGNKTIDVKFLIGTTDTYKDESGNIQTAKRVTDLNVETDYIVHPAFTTDINNGGWDKELSGFWVAKYAAGYQNATEGEETKTVQNSSLKYTELNGYTSNFLNSSLTINTELSYPVFKANTYAYNIISVGDAWLLSQEIDGIDKDGSKVDNANNMYGLSNVDSHLEKNSEWGAVAYLTHSQYGVNGNSTNMNEVTINNKNLSNSINVNNETTGTKANVYAVTSYGESSNKANDINASSTKNMTGVFDLSGCIWERTATFLKGGGASTPTWHSAMANTGTSASSKYLTLYTENKKKGDATNETAGWNLDYSIFVISDDPVFARGGCYSNGDNAGVFAFCYDNGAPYYNGGFRVCLAF